MKIPDRILARTKRCGSDFSCLSITNGECLCQVETVPPNTEVLFVIPPHDLNCPYLITTYPDVSMCTCPVNNYRERGKTAEMSHVEIFQPGSCPKQ